MIKPVLVIHGGAGAIPRTETTPEVRQQYEDALRQILNEAGAILAIGGSALDAVTEAVRLLEECPLFNAGYGAVFTSAGKHELDASIMNGKTLQSGAIANVTTVRNPILAARAVMERSSHVFLVGTGADDFAREQGLECVDPAFFSTTARREQLDRVQRTLGGGMVLDHDAQSLSAAPLDEDKKLGTVGAVALDSHGNLAAATSTGGMTNKQPGRVGDAPMIGAGCYANNRSCAVSTTGTGEMFIRMVAAYDVSAQMEYAGRTLEEATHSVVYDKLPTIAGAGGLIAVDAEGNISLPFNTEGMYRGYIKVGEQPFVAIHDKPEEALLSQDG
ncbi:isoaspartyl peptidase/L-asparaginase [Candidimonas sp. SYP-B2681]|uniref:isoaspartyl peptidase/L-asparaginase family protein n=1 Tax=Candidimonas sp. SYP-B2681 TaxID=2497686 RepID=UPI000F86D378|nr:isoaspartyl peptidase/L-asparaginase [Candidimonas sp. SYP-B2681]RTZ45537.1 isoaspartyl peptidase/L-asparaginase [Candidimonas sp. SYP-B2681]